MSNVLPGLLVVSLLGFSALACGHADSSAASAGETGPLDSVTRAGDSVPLVDAAGLFLMAPSYPVTESGELWIPFRSGASLPGSPVKKLGVLFDPLFFRIAGEQWSLEPALDPGKTGAIGLRPKLTAAQRGAAMIGFSTRPVVSSSDKDAVTVRMQRHVKLLFHARGSAVERSTASAAVTARFGLRMEFVPLIDPLPLKIGTELPLRLRFDGPGLARTLVQAQFLAAGEGEKTVHVEQRMSDANGHFVLPIHAKGTWRLMAMHQRRAEDGAIERHFSEIVFRTGGR